MKLSKYEDKNGWENYTKDINDFMNSVDGNGDKGDRTILSIDLMDMWVAVNHPETIDEWVRKCSECEDKTLYTTNENGERIARTDKDGNHITRKDRKAIIKLFLDSYSEFEEYTDRARQARKDNSKSEWQRKLDENNRIRNMTPEERFKEKMNRLKKIKQSAEETPNPETKPETVEE